MIETLYSSLRAGSADAAAACYARDAHFEDIAFRLESREEIRTIRRLVCDPNTELKVTKFQVDFADDDRGSGRWVADYRFNKTSSSRGRKVISDIASEFAFRGGEIIRHDDRVDPMVWANQAYAFPMSGLVGRIELLRRLGARSKLRKFRKKHPEPSADFD